MKKFLRNNNGYISATMALIGTIIIAYILFIAIMPTMDVLVSNYIVLLDDNQFYSNSLSDRLDSAQNFGWKMPFAFIALGFIFIIVRTIVRQKYTRYDRKNDY